ncbi:vacuolar iron family transporter [Nannochloropsis oceanica]
MAVGNGSTTAELESGLSSGGGAAETQQHHSQPLQQEEDIKDKDPETLIKMAFAAQNAKLSKEAHNAKAAALSMSGPPSSSPTMPTGVLPSTSLSSSPSAFAPGKSALPSTPMPAEGGHVWRESEFSSYLITGAVGGIFGSLSLACASAGGHVPRHFVALLGVSQSLALSLGMAALHVVMNKEEVAYCQRERRREEWETENYPEGERREMVAIYTSRGGMSPPDATLVIDTLLQYPRFFIDNMVVWELGLLPFTKDFSVLRGTVALFSSLFAGIIPLLPFCFRPLSSSLPSHLPVYLSAAFAFLLLFGLGVTKARLLDQPRASTVGVLFGMGTAVAAISLGIGAGLGAVLV